MLKSIIFSVLGALSLHVLNAQNIGVFTTSPQAPLHIFNGGQVNTPGGFLVLGNPSEAHIEMDFDRIQAKFGGNRLPMHIQPEGGNLNLSNGGIFIDWNNGEIGLGTASPDAPVHVYGNGELNVPGGLLVLGHTGLAHMELDFDRIQSNHNVSSFLTLKIQPDGGDLNIGNNALFVENTQNRVGIGTTSTPARLHVRGAGFTESTIGLQVTNAFGQTSLYVDDAGNVGINGVTTPTSALEVAGSIELSGDVKSRNNNNTEIAFSLDGDDLAFRANGTEVAFFDGVTKDIILAENDLTQVAIGDVFDLNAKLEIYAPLLEHPFIISGILADFIVNSNGRVGIGDLNPSADLQVRCSDNMAIGGIEIENVNDDGSQWRLYVNRENQEENGYLHLMHNDASVGYFTTGGNYFSTSDIRKKTDIKPVGDVLDRVNSIQASSYFFKKDTKQHSRSLGLIAQEVQPLFPELVEYSAKEDMYRMDYSGVSVVAIKAIQELDAEKKALEERVAALELLVEQLSATVETIGRVKMNVAQRD